LRAESDSQPPHAHVTGRVGFTGAPRRGGGDATPRRVLTAAHSPHRRAEADLRAALELDPDGIAKAVRRELGVLKRRRAAQKARERKAAA